MRAVRCDRCHEFEEGEGHKITDCTVFNTDKTICDVCWKEFVYWFGHVLRVAKQGR